MKHRTMGARAAMKVVPLHDALKPFAFRYTGDVYAFALRKNIYFHGGADLNLAGRAEFPEVTKRRQLRLFEVGFARFVALPVRYLLKGNLDRCVTIPLGCFHLRHATGSGLNNSDRHHTAA